MLDKGGAFLAAPQGLNLVEKVSFDGYSHTRFHGDKLPMGSYINYMFLDYFNFVIFIIQCVKNIRDKCV